MRLKTVFLLPGIFFVALFFNCQPSTDKAEVRREQAPLKNENVATFAEGCFWHSELVFQSLEGVRDAVSGYAGGTDTIPDYEKVSTGSTGHAETVQVYYDPSVISYRTLVNAFFASHDPTSLNRQGQDVGTEYRSVAFYRSPIEKQIIDSAILNLDGQKKYTNKIVTEVKPLTAFYPAEDFHQEYVEKHHENDYVKYVSIPEFLAFKMDFKANYKPVSAQ